MCPSCGCTNFDVERRTERSEQTGEPKEYLRLTCQDCGHSWRAPTLAEQKDW
jgi:RNase P subunit RPR2